MGKAKRQLYENLDKQQRVKQAQIERNQYEDEHLGGFTRIFPVENEEQQALY